MELVLIVCSLLSFIVVLLLINLKVNKLNEEIKEVNEELNVLAKNIDVEEQASINAEAFLADDLRDLERRIHVLESKNLKKKMLTGKKR